MSITIETTIDRSKLVTQALQEAAKLAITKACFDTQAKAQAIVPVDTGNLKNSIQVDLSELEELSGEVVPQAEYAVYVEFGTSKMPAQPYMTPAAEEVGASFVEVMERLMAAELGN